MVLIAKFLLRINVQKPTGSRYRIEQNVVTSIGLRKKSQSERLD